MNIFCIGCRYLDFKPGELGKYGSSWTGKYADTESAALVCKHGHWSMYLGPKQEDYYGKKPEAESILDIENAMRHAATCPDYAERPEADGERHG